MAVEGLGGSGNGIAFLVSAGVMYEIIAAACSSPQTTELNAKTRAPTLMKWVHIGIVQGVAFVAVAALIDPAHRQAILWGGGVAAVLLYGQYAHAKQAGLTSGDPPTEQHSGGGATMLAWGNPT